MMVSQKQVTDQRRIVVGSGSRKGTILFALILACALLLTVTPASWGQPSDESAVQRPPDERLGDKQPTEAPAASDLLRKAEREGTVRVIVGLRTDFVPEGRLSRTEAADQRADIESSRAGLQRELQGTGFRTLREYDTIPYIALELPPQALEAARRSPLVVSIVEDRPIPAVLAQSAPIVQAPSMWANGFTGAGQVVAVLDTGVDTSHPFLAGKVVEEACYSVNGNCPNGQVSQTGAGAGVPCVYAPDGCRHGTHVAGIAAGQGSTFSGVGKGASIMSVQVFSRFTGAANCGAGEDPCTLSSFSDQIEGLERVFALRSTRNFSSVNVSIGGGRFFTNCDTSTSVPASAYKAAIDNLRSVNIPTVIASGNEGFTDSTAFPACISSAVSVGSTTKSDTISSFSNSASFLSLLAPGSSINSSVPPALSGGQQFAVFNGTSMAAPHVAGAWALLKQQNPTASVASILSALQSTGTAVTDTRVAGGVTKRRINIASAAATLNPLANDNFANAEMLTGATDTTTGTNAGATKEAGEPAHAGNAGGRSVWYRWTPQSSGTVTIDTTGSSFDTLLGVYTGSAVNGLNHVASNDDENAAANIRTSKVTFQAAGGTTYRIAVDGFSGASGNITLNLASSGGGPANDNFANAEELIGASETATGTNVGATKETGEPNHAGNAGGKSVWYRWTPQTSGPATIETIGSNFDTLLAAYTGAAVNSLGTPVASNDDADNGRQSRITFQATAGTTYRIAVDGFSGASGNISLRAAVESSRPETTLTSGPPNRTKKRGATFTFVSDVPNSTFRCSLDGGPFTACTSPRSYTVSRKAHTFRVYAVSPAGTVDTTPAVDTWKVLRR